MPNCWRRLAADTTTVSDQVCLNLNVALRSVTQAAMVLVFMFAASWRLTVVTFIIIPVILAICKLYGQYYRSETLPHNACTFFNCCTLIAVLQVRLIIVQKCMVHCVCASLCSQCGAASSSLVCPRHTWLLMYRHMHIPIDIQYIAILTSTTSSTAVTLWYSVQAVTGGSAECWPSRCRQN